MADFNRLANFYDVLKRIVFGHQIDLASTTFLADIEENAKILVVGGGSGRLLEKFRFSHQIKFVELSSSMILKASRVHSVASVQFINENILVWKTDENFDYIITPFILDCFSEAELVHLVPKLKEFLKANGRWIQTDFYPKTAWHRVFIKLMYVFFRITTGLKTREIANFDLIFSAHDLSCTRNALFYHSMIESKIYQEIE